MDDMNAFERQLARDAVRDVGSIRPVDDLAIFNSIAATQSPKWRFGSMFSATKFVVAGAIVALFGGFLLAGVGTQPSDEQVPAVGATASAGASLLPEPVLDVRELEWRPLDLDEATFGPGARLADIAASDSRLAIGGSADGNAAVWTSTDGLTWERVPHDDEVFGGPADREIKAIVPWRDGFVAAGEVNPGGDFDPQRVAAVWISRDGKDWARVPHDEEVFGGRGRQEMFDIAASDDRLAIVGFDEEGPCCSDARADHDIAVWTSDDGSDWTRQTFGGGEMLALAGTAEGFVGVGHRGMWTSPDGLQWEREDPGALRHATLLGVAPTASGFVAVGLDTPPGELPGAWTSSDGADWTPAEIVAPLNVDEWWMPQDVAVAGSGLAQVAGPSPYGDGTSAILVSEDGRSWVPGETSTPVSDARLRKVTAFGDHFVAIGSARGPWEPGQAGIWTTIGPKPSVPSEPEPVERDTSTPDLLPGVDLVTEEVQPGVFRVVEDGHRDLSRPVVGKGHESSTYRSNLAVGQDGSVWIFGPERFFRLGDPREHASDDGTPAFLGQQVEVGPDGVVWALDGWYLRSFDGTSWEVAQDGVKAFDVALDGVVWALRRGAYERLEPDGWSTVGRDESMSASAFFGPPRFWVSPVVHDAFASDSQVPDPEIEILSWPGSCAPDDDLGGCLPNINLYGNDTFDSAPANALDAYIHLVDMSDGGDYWMLQSVGDYSESSTIDYLVHGEGGRTTVHSSEEGVPEIGVLYDRGPGWLKAGPEGTVWLTPGSESDDACGGGVAWFDGQTWTRYLRGTCIYALDVATDGSAWVQGGTRDGTEMGPVETYVITPETEAADE